MVTVKCHSCDECFGSIDSFQIHFSIKHPTCAYFKCVVETCGRSFNMWNSYRKHLRKKHNVSNRFNECNDVMQFDNTCSYNQNVSLYTNIVRETELFDSISPPDFHTLLKKHVNILVRINTKPSLARNQGDSLIEDVSIFLGSFLKISEQKVIDTLLTYHAKDEDISSIADMFKSLSNPFDHLTTEYKRMLYFKSTGAYIPSETYNIDFCLERKNTTNGVKPPVTAQYISLRYVLQKFLELPDVFNITVKYMQQLQEETYNL